MNNRCKKHDLFACRECYPNAGDDFVMNTVGLPQIRTRKFGNIYMAVATGSDCLGLRKTKKEAEDNFREMAGIQ